MKHYGFTVDGAWGTDISLAIGMVEVPDLVVEPVNGEQPTKLVNQAQLRMCGMCTDEKGQEVARFVVGMPHGPEQLGDPTTIVLCQVDAPRMLTMNEIIEAAATAIPEAYSKLKKDIADYEYKLKDSTVPVKLHDSGV